LGHVAIFLLLSHHKAKKRAKKPSVVCDFYRVTRKKKVFGFLLLLSVAAKDKKGHVSKVSSAAVDYTGINENTSPLLLEVPSVASLRLSIDGRLWLKVMRRQNRHKVTSSQCLVDCFRAGVDEHADDFVGKDDSAAQENHGDEKERNLEYDKGRGLALSD
jgi:hypothetical protein